MRDKNAANIMMKNVLDLGLGSLSYFLVGWAFSFGGGADGNPYIGQGGRRGREKNTLKLAPQVALIWRSSHDRIRGPNFLDT